MLSLPAVKSAMLEKLHSSMLTVKHAEKLHMQPMTEKMAADLGINPAWAGFKIPYFTPDGKVTEFYRYRYVQYQPSNGFGAQVTPPTKPLRYVQPKNSDPHVYMPPLLGRETWHDVMNNGELSILVTEGELKSACVCVNGQVMLGLGGVFSWTSKRNGQELIPDLEKFKWLKRKVYICFDSDKNTKPMVRLALSRLAITLTKRGAEVFDLDVPPGKDGEKQGIDDFLFKGGKMDDIMVSPNPIDFSLELHRLNDEVGLIWSGGAAGNIVRFNDGRIMTPQQFTRSLYKDRVYIERRVSPDGTPAMPKPKPAAESWLSWQCRVKVNGLTYAPGQPRITDDGACNIWQDCGVRPAKGSIAPWEDLLRRVLVNLEPAHVLWLKRWLAYPLRYPGTKLFNCVLIWSHKGGTGKNLMAEAMEPLYGTANCSTIKSRHLTSDFNSWAEGKQFIIGDEITLDDKRHTSGDLKSMLTSRTVRINRKGVESYVIPDCANYWFTSNDPVSVMLDKGERRTFVIHAPEEPIGDEYGRKFKAWLNEQEGAAAIAHYLVNELDMGDFSPTAEPPATEARQELIAHSMSDIDSWVEALKENPDKYLMGSNSKFSTNASACYTIYTPEDLLKLYDPDDKKRAGARAMGIALDKAGFRKAAYNNGKVNGVRSTFWLIRATGNMTSVQAARVYQQERPDFMKGRRTQ